MSVVRSLSSEPDWTPSLMKDRLKEVRFAFLVGSIDDERLWRWLTHPWPQVREATLEGLASRPAFPGLLDILAEMVDDPVVRDVRVVLPFVLEKYGGLAEEPLLRLLECAWWEVRNNATIALRKVGTRESISQLSDLAQGDPGKYVRQNAQKAVNSILARV